MPSATFVDGIFIMLLKNIPCEVVYFFKNDYI